MPAGSGLSAPVVLVETELLAAVLALRRALVLVRVVVEPGVGAEAAVADRTLVARLVILVVVADHRRAGYRVEGGGYPNSESISDRMCASVWQVLVRCGYSGLRRSAAVSRSTDGSISA